MSRRNRRERHQPPPPRPPIVDEGPAWQPNERGTGASIRLGEAVGSVGWLELIGLVRWAVLGRGGLSCHGFVEVPLDRGPDGITAAMIVARNLVESVLGAYARGLELG